MNLNLENQYNFPIKLVPYSTGQQILRVDTGEILSTVTKKYNLITHSEAVKTLEDCFSQSGLSNEINVEKAFLFGASKTSLFMSFSTKKEIKFNKDLFKICFYLRNSYDALSRFTIGASLLRLVCSNGMYSPDKSCFISIKHLGKSVHSRVVDFISEGYKSIENIIKYFRTFEKTPFIGERVLVGVKEYEQMLEMNIFDTYRNTLGNNVYAEYQGYTDWITHKCIDNKKEVYNKKLIPKLLEKINERNNKRSHK